MPKAVKKKTKPAAKISAKGKTATIVKPAKKVASQKESGSDIVKLILEDHKPLKKLIKTLKDSDLDMDERRDALEEFAPLLVTHAKPEEQTLYNFMKRDEDTREEGYEGDVEHALADQLLEEIERTDDEDLWSARVKVLAELVEHHIEEEERELLPAFRKNSEISDRTELGENYLHLKEQLQERGGREAPSEVEIEQNPPI